MSQLHIAIAFGTFNVGGAETVMIRLANGFVSSGIRVSIIVLNADGVLSERIDKRIQVFSLKVNRARDGIRKFRKFLESRNPDVIISAQTHIQLMTLLASIGTKWNGKIILNEHSLFSHNNKSAFNLLLARILFRRAHAIAAVSEAVREDFEKIFGRKVVVIHNAAFDNHILELKELSYELTRQGDFILTVGRLTASKNYKLLIDAFAIVLKKKPCRLYFAGDGEEIHNLKRYAESKNVLNMTIFMGNHANPFIFMDKCRAFVMTSLYEGLPTVLVEALACCCNIVCVDGPGGIREIITDDRYGTISKNNAEDLANAILDSFGKNDHCELKLNKAKSFSADIAVDKYLKLISELK